MVIWVVFFGLFLLFIPFNRKSQKRPASVYIAFVIALAFEMFGIPLSLYIVTWAFGLTLPKGILWGCTLQQYVGDWGMIIGFAMFLVGALFVILGWKEIHKHYWSKEEGKGRLVTGGIYAYVRHPQYTGFLLTTLGMIVYWATIPVLIMWPILALKYYRLAKREEREMEKEFENDYTKYKRKTPMFIPFWR